MKKNLFSRFLPLLRQTSERDAREERHFQNGVVMDCKWARPHSDKHEWLQNTLSIVFAQNLI